MDNIRGSVPAPAPSGPVSTPKPAPAPVNSGASQVHHAPAPSHAKKPKSKRNKLFIVGALVVAAAIGVFVFLTAQSTQLVDTGKYQAVFFTNGQVYFGKLEQLNGGYMKLTKVFYLETKDGAAAGDDAQKTTSQSSAQLIKMGDEVHGPEDAMIISKDQVMFYENLRSDSKVTAKIDEYLNKK